MRLDARIGRLAAIASCSIASAATVSADTISSTQLQSNFNGALAPGQSAAISASAFDFSGQPQLLSIQSISITLTMIDGDTGLGPNGINETPNPPDGNQHGDDDVFVNTLHLRLDGIETGSNLLLNGFNSYDNSMPLAASDFVTVTITGLPDNGAAILAALQDGTLSATIFDAGFSDPTLTGQNAFRVPDTAFDGTTSIFATLSITGTPVPEPNTIFSVGTGVILLALLRRRPRSVLERFIGLKLFRNTVAQTLATDTN
jgi:hypothetical protein